MICHGGEARGDFVGLSNGGVAMNLERGVIVMRQQGKREKKESACR